MTQTVEPIINGQRTRTTTISVVTSAGNISLTDAQCRDTYVEITAAGTASLPAGAEGLATTIRASGAFTIHIDPDGSEVIVLNDTALTGGNKISSTGAANDAATLIHNGTNWIVIGTSAWTDGGA